MNQGQTSDTWTMRSAPRHLFSVNEGWMWGKHHLCWRQWGHISAARNWSSSQSSPLWRAQPTAGWQTQLRWGRQSVVIESLTEQNLVCAIIVHRALTEAKIHSTWCIHCFQPNTHQAPYLQAWLLYNNSSLPKQLKDNCRTRCNYVVNVMECWVMEWIGSMGNSGRDVKAPTQFGDSRSFYFNISPQINTWINSINTSLGHMCITNKNISSTESFI